MRAVEKNMSKNERTGSKAASLAGKALAGQTLTKTQVKTVAASALTQAPTKPHKKR